MTSPRDLSAVMAAGGWQEASVRRPDVWLERPGLKLHIEHWRGGHIAEIVPADKDTVFEGRGSRDRASAHVLEIFAEHAGYLEKSGIELRRVSVWMSRGAVAAGGYEAVPHDRSGKIDWTIQ